MAISRQIRRAQEREKLRKKEITGPGKRKNCHILPILNLYENIHWIVSLYLRSKKERMMYEKNSIC